MSEYELKEEARQILDSYLTDYVTSAKKYGLTDEQIKDEVLDLLFDAGVQCD